MNKYFYYLAIVAIVAVSLFLYFTAANAQAIPNVALPVRELGNCKNQQECFAYCNQMANIPACVSFAEKHNLLTGKDLEDAQKVADLVSKGVKTPGNCASKESCENYCSNTSHLEECLNFGEKAGFVSSDEAAQARKFIPFVLKGETPGGCKNKDECESYCADSSHFNECVDFAEKAGIINKEDADMARKAGGKGPGDCNSAVSCNDFCNKPENSGTCFNFAKDHNLIPPDQLQEIENGMVKLKAGLTQAPPELLNCLKNGLGQNVIEQIQNGTLVPGPNIGEKVQACLDTSLSSVKSQMQSALKNAPKTFEECLSGKIGADNLSKIKEGKISEDMMQNFGEMMQSCKQSLVPASIPAEVKSCLDNSYGAGFVDKALSGEVPIPEDLNDEVEGCIKSWTDSQINACLNLSCSEFFSCIQKLQKSGGISGEGGNISNPAAEEKIKSCSKQQGQEQQNKQSKEIQKNTQQQIQENVQGQEEQYQPSNQPSSGNQTECSSFASAPDCSYVGPENSENYKLCKQCFPNK